MPFDTPLNRSVRPRSAAPYRPKELLDRMSASRPTVSTEKFRWLSSEVSEPLPLTSKQRLLAAQRKAESANRTLTKVVSRFAPSPSGQEEDESLRQFGGYGADGRSGRQTQAEKAHVPVGEKRPTTAFARTRTLPKSSGGATTTGSQERNGGSKATAESVVDFISPLQMRPPASREGSEPRKGAPSGGSSVTQDETTLGSILAGMGMGQQLQQQPSERRTNQTVGEHNGITKGLGVLETQCPISGFASTPFTPLDPEYFGESLEDVRSDLVPEKLTSAAALQSKLETEGQQLNPTTASHSGGEETHSVSGKAPNTEETAPLNKGRALFQQWCSKAVEECGEFRYRLVWIRSVLQQLRHSTASLEQPNVYRLLTATALLASALQVAVSDGESKALVFSLLDEVLAGVFQGWPTPKDNSGTSDQELQQPTASTKRSSSTTGIAPPSPGQDYQPYSLSLVSSATAPQYFALGNYLLYSEIYTSETLRRQKSVKECEERLQRADETLSRQTHVIYEQIKRTQLTVKSYVFSAWRRYSSAGTKRRTSAKSVVNHLSQYHHNTLLKTAMLAFRMNAMRCVSTRAEVSVGDQVRDWRGKEAKLILDVSTVKAQLATSTAEYKMELEEQELRHNAIQRELEGELKKIKDEMKGYNAVLSEAEAARDKNFAEKERWRYLCNAAVSEMVPYDRTDVADELLFVTSGEEQTGPKLQVSPFSNITEVVTSPAAANRILLLFANSLLRRWRPEHSHVENFGRDLADCEVYFSALLTLFPKRITSKAFEIVGNAPRAQEVCRVLADVGLDTLVAPVDIVLGVVLRNLGLLTTLLRLFGASTHHGTSLKEGMECLKYCATSTTQTSAGTALADGEKSEGQSVAASPPQEKIPVKSVIRFRFKDSDCEEAERRLVLSALRNRAWNYITDFVQRDTLQKIQNVRQEGEVLDERRRREMEWFLTINETFLDESILQTNTVNNTRNEVDKIASVLGSYGFDLLSTYFAYAAHAESGSRMSQLALLKFYEDLRCFPSNRAIDEGYKFATRSAASMRMGTGEEEADGEAEGGVEEGAIATELVGADGLTFAPTAVGAAKRKMTNFATQLPVSPSIFVHTVVYLAHFKYVLGGKKGSALGGKKSVTTGRPGSSAGGGANQEVEGMPHHVALRHFLEEDVFPKCRSSGVDKFRLQSRSVIVQQVYRRVQKPLMKAFRQYCSRTLDGESFDASKATHQKSAVGGHGGSGTTSTPGEGVAVHVALPVDGIMMALEDCQKFCRDFRLTDRFQAQEVQSLFHQFTNNETQLVDFCRRFPYVREPPKYQGLPYAEWLDWLSAVAAQRYPAPYLPLHTKVEQLFRDTLNVRLKELLG